MGQNPPPTSPPSSQFFTNVIVSTLGSFVGGLLVVWLTGGVRSIVVLAVLVFLILVYVLRYLRNRLGLVAAIGAIFVGLLVATLLSLVVIIPGIQSGSTNLSPSSTNLAGTSATALIADNASPVITAVASSSETADPSPTTPPDFAALLEDTNAIWDPNANDKPFLLPHGTLYKYAGERLGNFCRVILLPDRSGAIAQPWVNCQAIGQPLPTEKPTARPTKTPVPRTLTPTVIPIISHYYVRIFNCDDRCRVYVNAQLVKEVEYKEDSGWIEVTQNIAQGENIVRFEVENDVSGYTFGWQVRENDSVVYDKKCGEAEVSGCGNGRIDLTHRKVAEESFKILKR